MAVKVVDSLFVVVCAARPTDEEWAAYLELVTRQGVERTKYLIVTDGGGPTSSQRRRLRERLAGHAVPVAVVSESTWVRCWVGVTAFSWLNRNVRAFAPTELVEVFAFLGIPRSRTGPIAGELVRLRRELAGEAPLGQRARDGS
jgi:hypothetical protein